MKSSQWETPDIARILSRREEVAGATTSANAGSYIQPLGMAGRPYEPLPGYEEVTEAFKDLYGTNNYGQVMKILRRDTYK